MSYPRLLFFACLVIVSTVTKAQVNIPYFGKQVLINGYSKALDGETIGYFSIYPKYAKEALLTRATDGKKSIEWETDMIPADAKGPYVYFTWIAAHSTATSKGVRNFDLYINDEYKLTFSTYPKQYPPYWTFGGKDSTRLVFEYKTKDGAGDAHGMAYLRVPISNYVKGKSIKLKVVGQNQGSFDWYMTFKYGFKEKIEVNALPFILRGNTVKQQPIRFVVLHFGKPQDLSVTIDNKTPKLFAVNNGFNVIDIPVTAVENPAKVRVRANIRNLLNIDTLISLKPVTYREINLVHHSHTDIGYSHIQEDVIKIHTENIRQAMRLIDKTKNYPEGSRFIWNIESAWAVENFLQEATEVEKKQFIDCVKKGQIVVSATYANILTGLSTPEEMNWITEYAGKIRDSFQLPIKTGMMSDVPGMSWSMVPALAKNGVRYFSNGPNYMGNPPYMGDRIGYTLLEQGDKAFWWKSSSGTDSILFWTGGRGYSSWHGTPQGGVEERGTEKIADYLDQLDAAQYPYSMIQWRYNIVSDNAPTDSTVSDFVRKWNEKYESPKLVLANVTDMFERFEKLYGKKIPVLKGDFTPYWEDGAYSTAKEESEARLASEKILSLEMLGKQTGKTINAGWLYKAKRGVVMFHEHTWGAHNSITSPDDPFVIHQWNYKKAFLDTSLFYIEKINDDLNNQLETAGKVKVYNTLNEKRSGYVEIAAPAFFKGDFLLDSKGNKIHVQRIAGGKLAFIAKEISPVGEETYSFSEEKNNNAKTFSPGINYTIDSITGAISQVETLDKEWVNNNEFKNLLQAVYVKGLDPSRVSFTSFKKMEWIENGPVVKTLRVTCSLEGTNEVQYEISQYNGLDFIRLAAIIDKKAVREKEAIHIAFPFALENEAVRIGVDDSFISPENGQLPGANKDFISVQRWIDVSDMQKGVTISCPQGALFEIGKLINEEKNYQGNKRWDSELQSSSQLFLYAMNNYWHTNYKADQEGKVRFDFYLSFHKSFDGKKAADFGKEITQPLITNSSK